MTISQIMTNVGLVFTKAIGWVGDVAGTITAVDAEGQLENPILLLFAALPLVGLGVGMFKRLISVN